MVSRSARPLVLAAVLLLCPSALAAELSLGLPGVDQAHYTALARDLLLALGPQARLAPEARPLVAVLDGEGAPDADLYVAPSDIQLRCLQAADKERLSTDVQQMRVLAPLFQEQIHAVVRADSPLRYLHEMAGHHAFLGGRRSRAELTAESLYRLLFYREAPLRVSFPVEAPARQLTAALAALETRELDVVIAVGAAPVEALAAVTPSAGGGGLRLLEFDPDHALSRRAGRAYPSATIRRGSYPWLTRDVRTLAVMTLLVTANDTAEPRRTLLAAAAASVARGLGLLVARGEQRALWARVAAPPPLPEDWSYYVLAWRGPAAAAEAPRRGTWWR